MNDKRSFDIPLLAKLTFVLLTVIASSASAASQSLKLVRSTISRIEGTDGTPQPATSFSIKDHIYYFTEVSWDDPHSPAGTHQLSYKWYNGSQIAFSFESAREFPSLPNFWSAWISGSHLGTGHHKVELYVDDALFDSQDFDITDVASLDEQQVRDSIRNQAAALLEAGDFDSFDRIATQFRQSADRTPAGDWKLAQLYIGVRHAGPDNADAPQWAKLDNISRQWLEAHPNSATAVIVRAKLLFERAWNYRGNGYASEVVQTGRARYQDLLEQARKVLDDHKAVAANDPEWDAIRIDIVRQQGGDSQAVLRAAAEALDRQAYYYPIHNSAVSALMPKWGGSEELIQQYVQMALDRSRVREGTQAYARIYQFVTRNAQNPLDELNMYGAKWPPMRQSLDEIMRAYPDPFNVDAARSMACLVGQNDYYRSLGRRTSINTASVGWWDTPEWRRSCDEAVYEGRVFDTPLPERLTHYSTFLRGFGTKFWTSIGLIITVVAAILELVLAIATRMSSTKSRMPQPTDPHQSSFTPSQYPRTYRLVSGSRWISTRMAVRMLVLGSTVAWLLWSVPWGNPGEVLQVFIPCILVALVGTAVIVRRFRHRVVLRPEAIEVHDVAVSRHMRRDQIAGCRKILVDNSIDTLVLVPNYTQGKELRIDRVNGADDAYWQWFSSLPQLDT